MKYSIINNNQKMTFVFSLLMASLSIFSCSNKQQNLQKVVTAEPILIYEKERTRGDRVPRYKVEFFDKQVMKYTGLANVSLMGEQVIEIEKGEFNAILKQLEITNFKTLASSYKGGMRDLPLTSISFDHHKITYNKENCPKELNSLATTIEKMVSDKILK